MTVWDSVGLIYFVIILVLGIFTYWMLNKYHMIGGNTAVKKAKQDNKRYETIQSDIRRLQSILGGCEHFCQLVGNGVDDKTTFEWQYIINRLFPMIKLLNRKLTVLELFGIIRIAQVFCVVFGAILFLLGVKGFGAVLIAIAFMIQPTLKLILQYMIDAKDAALEKDFPGLYLLLYSRLTKGVNARLAPTLTDYIRSMNSIYLPNEHKEIREFVYDLRNNIEVYSDESIAVTKLKEKYSSAMMLNFINLALQALRGTDNADNLLAFKLELSNRETEQMKAEAAKRAEKARNVVNIVFVIMFEFIILSVASKMPSLSSIFSMLN